MTNIADSVYIIHRIGRDFEARASEFFGIEVVKEYMNYSNIIEVCKNRQFGVVDYLVGMYYEPESRRLKNSIAENIIYGWNEEPIQQEIKDENDTSEKQDDFSGMNEFMDSFNSPF